MTCVCVVPGMYILIISTLNPIMKMCAKETSETASWVKGEWTYFLFHVGLLKYKVLQKVNGMEVNMYENSYCFKVLQK